MGIDLLSLNSGVGRGQPNDEDDVASTDNALREIGAYLPPPEYTSEPQRYITAPAVEALEAFQEQNWLKIDGYAKPGGPTERAINNRLLGKPRGAGLLHDFEMTVGDTVGNGFSNQPRDVQTVKRTLGGLGYLPEDPFDRPSGFIDESTTDTLRRFQERNGLRVDGWLAPGGETEDALRHAAERLVQANAPSWRRFWHQAGSLDEVTGIETGHENTADAGQELSRLPTTNGARIAGTGASGWAAPKMVLGQLADAGIDQTPLRQEPSPLNYAPTSTAAEEDSRSAPDSRASGDHAAMPSHESGQHVIDPEVNFGSWSFKREAVLPPGIQPPRNPLKRDVVGTVPFEGGGEFDTGIDRRREIRFLISRLYRAGAVDAGGRLRLSDEDLERYLVSAADHIKSEHYPIFEITARAVRAGVVDWHVAATRLAAYYAPQGGGEKIIDFILDLTPVIGQVKAAKELVEGIQDAIDAQAYGDEKAFENALAKATGAAAAIALPGAAAGAARLFRKEAHHIVALYLGGRADGPTLPIPAFWHRISGSSVHAKMNRYFGEHFPGLVAGPGYSGSSIVVLYSISYRKNALDRFYRTFEHSTRSHEKRLYETWTKLYPEARKYFLP